MKLILSIFSFLFCTSIFAQNVGINDDFPSHTLSIITPDSTALRLQSSSGNYGEGARLEFGDLNRVYIEEKNDDNLTIFGGFSTSLMGFLTHKVGIGTANPEKQLHLEGLLPEILLRGIDNTQAGRVKFSQNNGTGMEMFYEADSDEFRWRMIDGGAGTFEDILKIDFYGNLALGQQIAAGYKFSVDGKIASEEVMVKLSENWPDYVFAEDYKLKTLNEIKLFIDENSHLPGIPPAQEIEEEGLTLGEMTRRMMEKIEELTLYTISQQEQLDEQARLLAEQQKLIENLEKRLK